MRLIMRSGGIFAHSCFKAAEPKTEATGGHHAVLAPTLGLWVRRPPLTSHIHVVAKALLSLALGPVIWLLLKMDKPPGR